MHIARTSIGKISDTVRQAALAPDEITAQVAASVQADRTPAENSQAVPSSSTRSFRPIVRHTRELPLGVSTKLFWCPQCRRQAD
jgi:hypothetical protein